MKTFFTILILVVTVPLMAQKTPRSGGMGYVSIGNAWINNHRINNRLTENGFSDFAPASMMLNAGGWGIIRNMMIGGEAAVITPSEINSPGFNASLTTGYGMFQFGILPVRDNSRFLVYPVFGIGVGGSRYTHQIDRLINGHSYEAVSDQWFMKAECNVAALPFTHFNRSRHAGFSGIFTAGFLMNPSSQSWVENTPNPLGVRPSQAYTSGWYIKLSIGGGGIGPVKQRDKE
jgi:hypothetical protein